MGASSVSGWSVQSLQATPTAGLTRRSSADRGSRQTTLAATMLAAALLIAGYLSDSALVLWSAAPPILWLASVHPVRLVQLLVFTTPIFPVLRLQQEFVSMQRISTKGAFLSCDDPILLGVAIAWILAQLRLPDHDREWFPGAAAWLMLVYPLVILANWGRLSGSQVLVSALYFLKWAQYASLLFVIPQLLRGRQALELAAQMPRLLGSALVISSAYAIFEVAESVRTGSYSQAASFPRASSFFGTLDPLRFGASEDPVNFGCYAMVACSIALAFSGLGRTSWLSPVTVVSGIASLLLSGSRAPWLAAAVAFALVYRLRSSRVVLGLLSALMLAILTYLLMPNLWTVTASRFEAIGMGADAAERSAMDRLEVALHSPVFDVDQYWLLGHGHSSYRFIADEHSARVTGSFSLSLYNFPLAAWYDAGPVGLCLWMLLFTQLRRRLSRIHARCTIPAVRQLALGLCGALWGLLVAAMFSEVPYNWRVMGSFYLPLAVCVAAERAWAKAQAAGVPVVLRWQRT